MKLLQQLSNNPTISYNPKLLFQNINGIVSMPLEKTHTWYDLLIFISLNSSELILIY